MTAHENPEGLPDVGVADLLRLLTLERLGSENFIGHSMLLGAPRVYGGQLLAQSLMAMGATVPGEHHLHSLHGYFIQPGDVRRPLALQVEVLREGRNFSTRAVKVQQGKRLVFSGAASFHRAEGDYQHFTAMPEVPPPHALPSESEYYAGQLSSLSARTSHTPLLMQLFERRSEHWRDWETPGPRPPVNGLWCRLRGSCGDDPLLSQAVMAYVCDLDLMNTAMRPRGIGSLQRGVQAASLDHAMWFHAPVQPDAWFYYDLRGPCAVGNRGLGQGGIFQHGRLVATAMQEGLLRELPVF